MTNELPTMLTTSYSNTSWYDGNNLNILGGAIDNVQPLNYINPALHTHDSFTQQETTTGVDEMSKDPKRRMVRVLIVDPDESVPLEQALLYDSGEQVTDLTNQELFFESGIADKLKEHNDVRKKLEDKEIKNKKSYLEPIRIRDLKMTVVEIAVF